MFSQPRGKTSYTVTFQSTELGPKHLASGIKYDNGFEMAMKPTNAYQRLRIHYILYYTSYTLYACNIIYS